MGGGQFLPRTDSLGRGTSRPRTRRRSSILETNLELAMRARADIPPWEREHRFDEHRRWRFDFAWPAYKLAVEVDGGLWSHGRHSRAGGVLGDCEKYEAALLQGWSVYRVPGQWVSGSRTGRPVTHTAHVIAILLNARGCPGAPQVLPFAGQAHNG